MPIKKKNNFWLVLILIPFIVFLVWIFYQYELEKKGEQTFYKAFGISIPDGYSINGIDVSKYQSYIYWKSVKQMKINNITIDFAFIKATEGIYSKDRMFERNWDLSKKNNITRGAYHFFIANKDAKSQAKNFIDNVSLTKGDLPPVIDIEKDYGLPKKELIQKVRVFVQELEKKYKVKPIIYTYADFYEQFFDNAFNDYPLWIAHYNKESAPNTNAKWIFWQHSEKGRVNGITELVDFNVFNGNKKDFYNLLLK